MTKSNLPRAVNWHLWTRCNYKCSYCFATFEDLPKKSYLDKQDSFKMLNDLVEFGASKITFVGGEPMLHPFLDELLDEAKKLKLTTCIVSNGSRITKKFLDGNRQNIDWIGLSIDASNDELHSKLGRGLNKDISRSKSNHLENAIKVWDLCKEYNIRMKLNTVVCKINASDNMSALVLSLKPERWKIFEAMSVEGQNSLKEDNLLLDPGEFDLWLERHRHVKEHGIQFVPESNDLMRGSYAMIDALGRFYSSASGSHVYSKPIPVVGVEEAWQKVNFSDELFLKRGGIYNWSSELVQI